MDNRFDLKEIWKDEVNRKKIIAISSLVFVCITFLVFYYGGDDDDVILTEIPMTEAEKVIEYNNKLQAVNDTNRNTQYFQKDLDEFFSDDNKQEVNTAYNDEERKADSLSKVFAYHNNTSNNTSISNSYVARPSNQNHSNTQKYNNQSNSYTNDDRVQSQNTEVLNIPNVKTEEQLLEEKRNALRGNNNYSSSNNNNRGKSINAVIRGTQVKTSNEELVLKTTEDMYINGITIPKNTYLYARLQFSNNRALASVSSVNVKGNIVPVNIELYGLDGNKGIPILNAKGESTTEVINQEMQNQVNRAGSAGRVINAIGNSLKSNKQMTITFIDNQSVILYMQ